jgi:lipocalin
MARTPSIPDTEYSSIVEFLGRQGYDVTKIQKVPQHW